MRPFKYFDLIMALFVTVLLVSNIASSAKIVDWGVSVLGLRLSFDAGTLLTPAHLGVLASLDVAELLCHPRPRVGEHGEQCGRCSRPSRRSRG